MHIKSVYINLYISQRNHLGHIENRSVSCTYDPVEKYREPAYSKTHTYTCSGLVHMHTHIHKCMQMQTHVHLYVRIYCRIGSTSPEWRSDRRASQHQTTLQVWFLLRSLFAHTPNKHTNILQRLLIFSGLREKQLPHQAALLWVNHTCQRADANLWINL